MIVLSCNNLYKSFGIDSILENICFTVNEGDKIGIIGINGTGKTTLMKIISGEYGYDDGDIYTSKDCEIGYLQQNTNFLSNNTILEEVLETTLMKIISGEYGYDDGDIYTSKDCEIGYLQQNTNFLSNNTILEEVLEVFKPLINMENYLRELEHKIAEEGSKDNSPILEKLMNDYSHTLEDFASKNGYGYKSDKYIVWW